MAELPVKQDDYFKSNPGNRYVVLGNKVKAFCYKFLLLFALTVSFHSCSDSYNHIIPNVPVGFQLNLNIVNELQIAGNSVFYPAAGFGGVIIYCELPGTYYAFDAACTNEISRTCVVENEGVLGTCPCCDSQFILLSGAYPSKGPATVPLKQYNVSVVNDFTIRVYN